jgi:hypothetical protein
VDASTSYWERQTSDWRMNRRRKHILKRWYLYLFFKIEKKTEKKQIR